MELPSVQEVIECAAKQSFRIEKDSTRFFLAAST